MMTEN